MLVLGIVILLVVVVVSIVVLANGSDPAVVDFSLYEMKTTTAGAFITGALALLLAVLALALIVKGLARSRRRSKETKQLRREAEHERTLRQQAEAARADGDSGEHLPDENPER